MVTRFEVFFFWWRVLTPGSSWMLGPVKIYVLWYSAILLSTNGLPFEPLLYCGQEQQLDWIDLQCFACVSRGACPAQLAQEYPSLPITGFCRGRFPGHARSASLLLWTCRKEQRKNVKAEISMLRDSIATGKIKVWNDSLVQKYLDVRRDMFSHSRQKVDVEHQSRCQLGLRVFDPGFQIAILCFSMQIHTDTWTPAANPQQQSPFCLLP